MTFGVVLTSMPRAALLRGSDGGPTSQRRAGERSCASVPGTVVDDSRSDPSGKGAMRPACGSLLRRACARSRRQAVLLAGAAACSDRADDLAVHGDRNAAFGCHRLLRKGHECRVARGILI